MEGFNETVYIMVIPSGSVYDGEGSKAFSALYGEIFYIPAEYDIMVIISPTRYQSPSGDYTVNEQGGSFIFDASWVSEIKEEEKDKSYTFIISRPLNELQEIFDDDYDEKRARETQDVPEPNIKEILPDAWMDETFIEVDGITITNKEAIEASGNMIIIIFMLSMLACICISFN